MKKVILELTLDGPIPAVTKQDIAEQSAEKLKNLEFTYSVMPEIDTSINEVNEKPISATLDTFGDIDDVINKSIPQSHTDKIFTSRQTIGIGRASKEQGGNREANLYNEDNDPLNEE